MRVADAVINALEAEGVSQVFSVTGGGSAWLNDAFAKSAKIEVTFTHHEQAAVIAAEAFARRSGQLGVALVTVGPGATNALTGVVGAWMDSIPLLVLSGQSFVSQTIGNSGLRQLGVQETDIVTMVKSTTKFASSSVSALDALEKLREAIQNALSARQGPVWLEIPADVQFASVTSSFRWEPTRALHEFKDVDTSGIVTSLHQAKRPLLHAGHGIRLAGAASTFRDFVKRTGIPVVLSHNGADLLPTSEKERVGVSGVFGNRAANLVLQSCDLYIAVGTRLNLTQTGQDPNRYAPHANKFMVDVDENELAKDYLHDFAGIHSDALRFLTDLAMDLGDYTCPSSWVRRITALKEKFPNAEPTSREESPGFVNSYTLMDALESSAQLFDSVVTDMGLAYQCAYQAFPIRPGQRMFTNTGLASMGWGLPAAIGASSAAQGEPVLCLTGDGGLMMNLQEISTLATTAAPILVIIFNNNGYLTLRQTQALGFESNFTGVDTSSGLNFPDFVAVAEAHGVAASRCLTVDEVLEKIELWSHSPHPLILDVKMDIEQIQGPRVISQKDQDGRPRQAALEDMWPYSQQTQYVLDQLMQ